MNGVPESYEQRKKRLARARTQRWRENLSEEEQFRLRQRKSEYGRMKRQMETPEEAETRRNIRNFNINIKRMQLQEQLEMEKERTRRSLLLRDVPKNTDMYTSAYVVCRSGVKQLDLGRRGITDCDSDQSPKKRFVEVHMEEGVEVIEVSQGTRDDVAFETVYCSFSYPGIKEEVPWEDWP